MEKQTLKNLILNYQAMFIYEDSSTLHAIKQIKNSGIDTVLIKDKSENKVGIFTTKDFINFLNLDCDLTQKISNLMTKPIKTLNQNATIAQALEFIKKQKFKRIVVVDENNTVLGIITQKELLRIVYNKWIELMKKEGDKISRTNEKLLQTKSHLEHMVSIDFLTKLYNKQKFESFLEYEINKIKRYANNTFSILLVD